MFVCCPITRILCFNIDNRLMIFKLKKIDFFSVLGPADHVRIMRGT